MKMLRPILGAFAALALTATASAANLSEQLGIQTWTLRNLKFEQVVEFAQKHGIKNLQMIGDHMNPKAPFEETRRKKAVLDAAAKAQARGWGYAQEAEKASQSRLAEKGLTIGTVPTDVRAGLDAIGATMANEWVEKAGDDGRKLLDAMRAK